jgi:branched-chain amino acid transport system permease protein
MLQQLVNGIALGSVYALIALGYTMVYGVLRLINFAHGDIYMLGAFVAYYVARAFGADHGAGLGTAAVVFVIAMATCALVGAAIERFAYRPLRNLPRLNSLITAIGVSLLLEFGGQMVFGPDYKPFPPLLVDRPVLVINPTYTPPVAAPPPGTPDVARIPGGWQLEIGGQPRTTFHAPGNWSLVVTSIQVIILVVSVVLMASLTWIVKKTRIGRAMRAISWDMRAASLMGITTDNVIAFTFAIGSALAAAAGILDAAYKPTINPLMGVLPGLKAFVAAVLGGIGNIPGAMLGGMLMGLAETAVVAAGKSTYRDAIAFAILILVLLIRPRGLLGAVSEEKV